MPAHANPKPATVPLDRIHPSPFGTRDADPGLVESVRGSGILHPVGLVPDGDGFRVVFGSRRVDAARKAGLPAVPASIFPADTPDADARVWFIAENVQRLAADPIAEADCLADLAADLPAAEMARRLGRPLSWVHQRLRLAALPARARVLLREGGGFAVSAVVLLARLPEAALLRTLESRPDSASSVEAARDALRAAGRPLATAPFPTDACTGCPRLDADGKGGLCLDAECFDAKADDALGAEIATIRREPGYTFAPCVVSPDSLDFASERDAARYRAHGATSLRDKRLATPEDDPTAAQPAILLDDGKARPVRLVPAPQPRDGRAMRNQPGQAAKLAASRIGQAVLHRLRARIASGPRQISPDDFPRLARALAAALSGLDDLDDSASFHLLLSVCADRLAAPLRLPAFRTDPETVSTHARRVLALLSNSPDDDLAALDLSK